jgi:hypothetical protein
VADKLDATLLVVGEFYESRKPYDALIESLGIAKRTRVIDRYIPDDEVALYFSAADVVGAAVQGRPPRAGSRRPRSRSNAR